MEINLNKQTQGKTMVAPISQMSKTKQFINSNGDIIDPDTKEVLVPVDEGVYIPTQEEREALEKKTVSNPEVKGIDAIVQEPYVQLANQLPVNEGVINKSPLTIQQEIEKAEAHLAELHEKKKAKIEQMKKELEMLEK